MRGAPLAHGSLTRIRPKMACANMIPASMILVASGIACLALSGLAMFKAMPREGKPAPSWVSTESRATLVALTVMILGLAGAVLLVKGIL
jgi:hypothetical protein